MNDRFQKLKQLVHRFTEFWGSQISITGLLIAIPYVLAGILTGLAVVVYSKIFVYAEEIMTTLYGKNIYYGLFLAPAFFYISWLIVRYFARAAAGSGIPQVMASLHLLSKNENANISPLLSLRIIVVKVISSTLALIGGAAIGREGPSLQISASIYTLVHRYRPKNFPEIKLQKMVMAGAAAGLAAAFNTPLGGIVFAIEELSKTSIHSFRSSLLLGVILAGLTAQSFVGSYLYLGYPHTQELELKAYLAIFIVASVAGMAGAFKSKIILWIIAFRNRLQKEWQQHAFVIVSGLLFAVFALLIGTDALGSGKTQMQQLLFREETDVSWTIFPARFFASIISFVSGIAGGIFAPSLSTGATVGGLFGQLISFTPDNKIIVLCGMIAFLTGVTRSPFTSAVLVLEMTDRHSAIFPMMFAAIIANFAAALIMKHSLYENLMKNYLPKEEHKFIQHHEEEL